MVEQAGPSNIVAFSQGPPLSIFVDPVNHKENKNLIVYFVTEDAPFEVPESPRFGDPF